MAQLSTLGSIAFMKFVISKRVRKILDRVLLAIMALYCICYLFMTLGGEYKPEASGRTKLFDWGWSVSDVYIWQPRYLLLKHNNYNAGGLAFGPLIYLDRFVWHRTKPI